MGHIFQMDLIDLQPTQLYISSIKLTAVIGIFDPTKPESLYPIPIKRLGDQIIMTDGHTRALAAYLADMREVPVYWDTDDLNMDAYAVCVQWCQEAGIYTIAGLEDRILNEQAFERKWIQRCQKLHQQLKQKHTALA